MRTFLRPGPRLADELECALSVALAIAFAHLTGAHNVSWAAFTGFVVMRGRVTESLLRGLLRIVGTIAGAGCALLLAPLVLPSPPAFALTAGLFATATLYGALTGKRAYAWLLAGLTFEMILFDALDHPGLDQMAFARTRLLEVLAGTAACLIVGIASAVSLRRRWPATPAPDAKRLGWHPHAFRHAAQAGVAVTLLAPLWLAFRLPELSQSCVTIMAAMLVPVTTLGATGFVPVSRRLIQRVAGCIAGAVLAAAMLLLAHGSVPLLVAGTCLGVVIGRHIENGASRIAYVGTQFVLAVLVVLVPDDYGAIEIGPALARLTGILIGMAVLEPVLLAWHLLGRRADAATAGDQPAGTSE
ncbi:FUSC family protein [Sphingomonas nostoxanthinifaciens]|nr:FUSC family protein [Sphingomonas nostoxanthinifaciens]